MTGHRAAFAGLRHLLYAVKTTALALAFCSVVFCAQARAGEFVVGIPCFNNVCDFPQFEAVLRELYTRTGNAVNFKRLPPLRDLVEADRGSIDASMARTRAAFENYPRLVQVSPSLCVYTLSIFSFDEELTRKKLNDLCGLRVGTVFGDLVSIELAKAAGLETTQYQSIPNMLRMLQQHHLDAALLPLNIAKANAAPMGLDGLHVSKPLAAIPLYHSLNAEHAALAPRLGEALRGMYEDGTVKRLLMGYYAPPAD